MGLESASYISQLVASNPDGAVDKVKAADDHLRLIKRVLQTQFPNLGEVAVTATAAQLNTAIGPSALESLGFDSLVGEAGKVPVVNANETGFEYSFSVPTGSISAFVLSTAPDGWTNCDGLTRNSATQSEYESLFALIGTTFGGTGASDFWMPDIQGRVIAGIDGSANRLTGYRQGVDGDTIGNTGGEEAHTQAADEVGKHRHQVNYDANDAEAGSGDNEIQPSGPDQQNTSYWPVGSTVKMNIVQPTIVMNYIIKL